LLVETNKEYIILDAGTGFYKVKDYLKARKPVYLFLSHFYLNHIISLHTLNRLHLAQRLDVYGPPPLKKVFDTFINKPYTACGALTGGSGMPATPVRPTWS
jgi:ribonuclease BN (tRNA processing enzyme)